MDSDSAGFGFEMPGFGFRFEMPGIVYKTMKKKHRLKFSKNHDNNQ